VTLKAGRLYLLAVENSKASADAVSAITGGSTFTSRATTQYNGTGNRITLLSSVPAVDVTGALTIDFGAGNTQTGCVWSLLECSGVNTATTDGVVQAVAATGNTANPTVALAAFGDARNATFSAFANLASAATPGPGWTEMADLSAATPAQFLETQWRVDSDRNASATITSGQWGAIACEIACDTSPLVIPPSTPGNPDIYMAMSCSGSTATLLRRVPGVGFSAAAGVLTVATTHPLPSTCIAATTVGVSCVVYLAGFSSRSLIG
jgi:hypothetical protein